jgi:hypothetical protein
MHDIFYNLSYHRLVYAVVNLHYHKYCVYWYFVVTDFKNISELRCFFAGVDTTNVEIHMELSYV